MSIIAPDVDYKHFEKLLEFWELQKDVPILEHPRRTLVRTENNTAYLYRWYAMIERKRKSLASYHDDYLLLIDMKLVISMRRISLDQYFNAASASHALDVQSQWNIVSFNSVTAGNVGQLNRIYLLNEDIQKNILQYL